ncbi:50S ribosome-binding GTPase [Aeoliella sp. ICT_H6.2]|uniref:tRNA modification GTPase MnmE n=1 Tax=Aeoliella straminimaris TaxID=2954799 RepID=A0A9X2F8S7_9BACT|nr:GTPase [Aeoliella straminimaris]MCO6043717.1 50S ribosome-binding GTPase [Aeoliella straminimaris]
MDLDDTIVAIASAAGGSPRGAVRISGPRAVALAGDLVGGSLPELTVATAIEALIPLDANRQLPATLFVWPGERSFTRQPTVEIHTLGSPPLLSLVVSRACVLGGRLARPGEFTLRAFLAGRIDLTQAEAVLGVIDASGDRALQTALAQLAGGMATPLAELREELLLLLADLEAGLDFADEDIEFIAPEVLAQRLETVTAVIGRLVQQLVGRGVADEVPRVVLAGPVNAGKSSLYNALVRRYGSHSNSVEAIESPEPGATRDYLSASVKLEGVECSLVDTAGAELVAGDPSPRSAAQTKRQEVYAAADLIVRCSDAAEKPADTAGELLVRTKCDLASDSAPMHSAIHTSAATGAGLDSLATAIAERLTAGTGDLVPSTAVRSSGSLHLALEAVTAAQALAACGESEELVATELRLALDELAQVAGEVYTDDILDRVFSRFCIGK